MRLKLLRRRLTITAPRMAVHSALPWPLRWMLAAVMLGLCGAIALYAFDFGRRIAGLEAYSKESFLRLQNEVLQLRAEKAESELVVNTAQSLLTAEKAASQHLLTQIKALEAANQLLRDDLLFFEKLIPANGSDAIAIRGLQAEMLGGALDGSQMRWQVLVLQPTKNAPEFKGLLMVTFTGTLNGLPWSQAIPAGGQPLHLRQYLRVEGVADLPAQAVVKNVSARVLEGSQVRAVQAIQLE
ncbi:hypothetical protein [Variovorax sp. HJSM1_2]|uniref:hypothetical protein n=1 Tax=Variovorax sp. HJSM1_2 TaxID=3366263 RepID=UPI003BDCAEEA